MTTWKIRLITAAVLAILAAIWILQNGDSVQVKFLFARITMPQSAMLSITLLIGTVVGIFLALGLSGKWNLQKPKL